MPESSNKDPHAELAHEIIGAAIAVQKELGPGLDEKLYENALCIELAERGISFQQQPEFPGHYHQRFIGKLKPDLIAEGAVIIEIKVAESFAPIHDAQLLSYLSISGPSLGLLLNFKVVPLGKRRILAPTSSLINQAL